MGPLPWVPCTSKTTLTLPLAFLHPHQWATLPSPQFPLPLECRFLLSLPLTRSSRETPWPHLWLPSPERGCWVQSRTPLRAASCPCLLVPQPRPEAKDENSVGRSTCLACQLARRRNTSRLGKVRGSNIRGCSHPRPAQPVTSCFFSCWGLTIESLDLCTAKLLQTFPVSGFA